MSEYLNQIANAMQSSNAMQIEHDRVIALTESINKMTDSIKVINPKQGDKLRLHHYCYVSGCDVIDAVEFATESDSEVCVLSNGGQFAIIAKSDIKEWLTLVDEIESEKKKQIDLIVALRADNLFSSERSFFVMMQDAGLLAEIIPNFECLK